MEIDCEGHLYSEVHTTIHTVHWCTGLNNQDNGKCAAALYALSGELVHMSTPACASLTLKIVCLLCVYAVYACVQVFKCAFVCAGVREGGCAHTPAHPLKGS